MPYRSTTWLGGQTKKLRIELTLCTKELTELGLHYAKSLTPDTLRALYFDYLRSLEMNEQISLSSEQLHSLLQRLRSTYILWMFGRGSPRYLA